MQLQSDKSQRLEEIKTQFRAREGYYILMNSPDYSQRSQRAMGFSTGTTNSNSSTASNDKTCIKISLVTINDNNNHDTIAEAIRQQHTPTTTTTNNPSSTSFTSTNANKQQPSTTTASNFINTIISTNNTNNNTNINNIVSNGSRSNNRKTRDKKICFNVGRELFVYNYDGVRTGPDASNPIYKKSYKGSSPTCHDFNQATATSGSLSLLVGFSHGQVQLIDLNGCDDQETCKEFNSDRLIDKTRVTCVKWLPNSPSLFLVSHASGHLYLYKDDLPCGPSAPTYQTYFQSPSITIYTCKTKTTRNPIHKWVLSNDSVNNSTLGSSNSSLHNVENESCALNEFVFSPCSNYLACVSQDGFLRVFNYDSMELVGRARSYYGGLSCVCWSPDGKYVVTGGEDDLITVWSFVQKRVVARGMGHKSWVSVVAFDKFYTGYDLKDNDVDNDDDEDELDKEVDEEDLEGEADEDDDDERNAIRGYNRNSSYMSSPSKNNQDHRTSYRFGSVGQDTQLCLWDLNYDLLQQPIPKSKTNLLTGSTSTTNFSHLVNSLGKQTIHDHQQPSNTNTLDGQQRQQQRELQSDRERTNTNDLPEIGRAESSSLHETNTNTNSEPGHSGTSGGFLSSKGSGFTKTFSLVVKRDKRNQTNRNQDSKRSTMNNQQNGAIEKLVDDPTKLLGSSICPRMNEVPLLEPTVCKKISLERLTSLIFCKGGFITSCQDGYVFSWARPSRKKATPSQSNEELRVIDVGTSSVV